VSSLDQDKARRRHSVMVFGDAAPLTMGEIDSSEAAADRR
jgi:hypothetical protein